MLQTRVANGELERLGPGLYRIAGSPSSWHQRVLTACLGGGDQCVASHRTAAALHRFDGFSPRTIEVTVPRSVRYRTALAVVHQSLDLEPRDCCHVGPIPVTTPSRTLIDLGAVKGWQRVEEAFDGAERDRTTARIAVTDRHREIRKRGRRGVGPMAVVHTVRSALNARSCDT
jgi:predicted transcriptional regulator of viral defense system